MSAPTWGQENVEEFYSTKLSMYDGLAQYKYRPSMILECLGGRRYQEERKKGVGSE